MQHRNALKTTPQPSLIDMVNEGFAVANHRLWVLIIPIALDLFLWLAPPIGIAPLLEQVRNLNPATWDQTIAAFGTQTSAAIAALDLRLIMFSGPLRLLLPTLQAPLSPLAVAPWQLSTWVGMLAMVLLFNLVALALAALYVSPLADTVKHTAPRTLRSLGRTIAAFVGVAALVIGTLFGVSLLMVLLIGVLSLVAQPLAIFVFVLWITIGVWWAFVTSFSFDAVALDGVGPLRAVWNSFLLVQRSLWAALGLWLLTTLIVLGFGVIWSTLATWNSVGLVVAMAGSAYITTGLAAAHLVFYRNRAAQRAQRGTAQRPS